MKPWGSHRYRKPSRPTTGLPTGPEPAGAAGVGSPPVPHPAARPSWASHRPRSGRRGIGGKPRTPAPARAGPVGNPHRTDREIPENQ
ncbi:hypothetical protein [Hymenobacter terrenus]|uniref:hypothetical protein n=1 Tax=Hymenobacter terrenus TaxID=1629124 RepID=UPI0018CF2718|nr:hypothetical protein [Hymenobacter terrenus]